MTENLKKKNVFEKIKENIDDKDEQLAFISVVVRLIVVAWSGFIVSLNYVSIPGYSNEPKDITFPASILTGVLSSFGVDAARKKGDKSKDVASKSDAITTQILRIEQAPIKIITENTNKWHVLQTKKKLGVIALVSILGISNLSLMNTLVSQKFKSPFPNLNLPVGPYTSYRVVTSEKGYSISYKANDPKILARTKLVDEE